MKEPYIKLSISIIFYIIFFQNSLLSINDIDSLKNEASLEKIDSVREKKYDDIVYYYLYKNADSALYYCNKSIEILQKNNNTEKLNERYYTLAKVYRNKGEIDKSVLFLKTCISNCKEMQNYELLGKCYSFKGTLFSDNNKKDSALFYFIKSYQLFDSIQFPYLVPALLKIQAVHFDLGDFEKALEYTLKADKILQERTIKTHLDTIKMAVVYTNLSSDYFNLNKDDLGKKYLFKAYKMNLKSKRYKSLGLSLNNISAYFLRINETDSALKYVSKAKSYSELTKNVEGIIRANQGIATVLFKKKQFKKAIRFLEEAKKMSIENDYTYRLPDIYKDLVSNSIQLKSNLTEEYFYKYDSIIQSTVLSNKQKAIQEYQIKFETAEKEKEIEKLRTEKIEKELASQKSKTRLTFIISLLALLILAVLLYHFIQKNKSERQVQNLKNQALRLQINPHFFFNAMNSINSYIGDNKPVEAKSYLSKFSKVMRLSLESVQQDLISLDQENEFLKNYLEIEKLRNQNFEFTIQIDEDIETEYVAIPPVLFQPYVENSIIHGFINKTSEQKGTLEIDIKKNNELINITIKDDGIGIKDNILENKDKSHKSLALSITQKRINLFSGKKTKVSFTKPKNTSGTIVSFDIPFVYLD